MNLVKYITGHSIEGHSISDLVDILSSRHSSKSVTMIGAGVIMLNDMSIIKCTKEYYKPIVEIKKTRSKSNNCFDIQKSLGVPRTVGSDCRQCHINCGLSHMAGDLSTK